MKEERRGWFFFSNINTCFENLQHPWNNLNYSSIYVISATDNVSLDLLIVPLCQNIMITAYLAFAFSHLISNGASARFVQPCFCLMAFPRLFLFSVSDKRLQRVTHLWNITLSTTESDDCPLKTFSLLISFYHYDLYQWLNWVSNLAFSGQRMHVVYWLMVD